MGQDSWYFSSDEDNQLGPMKVEEFRMKEYQPPREGLKEFIKKFNYFVSEYDPNLLVFSVIHGHHGNAVGKKLLRQYLSGQGMKLRYFYGEEVGNEGITFVIPYNRLSFENPYFDDNPYLEEISDNEIDVLYKYLDLDDRD